MAALTEQEGYQDDAHKRAEAERSALTVDRNDAADIKTWTPS